MDTGPNRIDAAQTLAILHEIFLDFSFDPMAGLPETVQKAVFLARHLQRRSHELQTPEETKAAAGLARLVDSPHDKATLIKLTDRSFRSKDPRRVTAQIRRLIAHDDIPAFMQGLDRTLMKIFVSFGQLLPGLSVPLLKRKIRNDTDSLILSAEPAQLEEHLTARHARGIRMNVNFLGEAILGEKEAGKRFHEYVRALESPFIEVVSVKISTIYSQITALGSDRCIDVLVERLQHLYHTAAAHAFERPDGLRTPKFVYLDMEEYRDMHITAQAFMRALDDPDLKRMPAGIALQAYIPDSFAAQQQITEWARARVAAGGEPVTLRIVKGANMEMEQIEAAHCGWPQAPYTEKRDTDANYLRMVHTGLAPQNIDAVRLGIASHNLFDLAFGLVTAAERGALDQVQFEMLEGMADSMRRALGEITGNLLLYAPATRPEDFISAIAYLIRRMDENTAPANFLRHSFSVRAGDAVWQQLEKEFVGAWRRMDTVPAQPRRTQNRLEPLNEAEAAARLAAGFANEPDTDFALPHNVRWARHIVDDWKQRHEHAAADIPLVVDGEDLFSDRKIRNCADPSRPGVVVGRYRVATDSDVERAVACAVGDSGLWRARTHEQRAEILARVAMEVRRARADLIGAAMAGAGKTVAESDPEVSEAVDFLEYYPRAVADLASRPGLDFNGLGVVAVTPPWNFPIAIPCGGVAAALAAGNTVILKPASSAVLCAWVLCRCFWRAGVSKRTLQFLPCEGATTGARLVAHHKVDAVILTGGTETAQAMFAARPEMNLYAETGGKNATIVTALSDRDQAVKNVIRSAFGHCGQKCSATSLLVLEEEVYEDDNFRRQLEDAVTSLRVGSAWDLATTVGPLIRPPAGALKQALHSLEPGEEWLVPPRQVDDNPHLWAPAVRWGVQPGAFTHMTELFGPVLSVIKARDLDDAIGIVNATGYGLTSGLESLDEDEQTRWKDLVRAGNLYVNRHTTGAMVLRQPFGGMGKSAFGPGIKAGGPNYPVPFMNIREVGPPETGREIHNPQLARFVVDLPAAARGDAALDPLQIDKIIAAVRSYDLEAEREFLAEHDAFRLRGQDNIRRYRPVQRLLIRVHAADSAFDTAARVCAAWAAGCGIIVSYQTEDRVPWIPMLRGLCAHWGARVQFKEQSGAALARLIKKGGAGRVRITHPDRVPQALYAAAAAAPAPVYIARAPVLMHGRIELLWYVREQSISDNYHRYGNLGDRAAESRASV